ncbi:MAG: hypothetical protein WAX07_08615 [Candidatus Altiarchaeia archaeon]
MDAIRRIIEKQTGKIQDIIQPRFAGGYAYPAEAIVSLSQAGKTSL